MKYKKITVLLTLCFSLLLCLNSFAQQSPQKELKLWYKQPADKWTDALPLGNGRLGAMVFAGVAQDRIQFNEETLWTGEPRDYNRPGAAAYLPELRKLLAEGKQEEAEKLATEKFMGMQSGEGKKDDWIKAMRSFKGMSGNPTQANYNDKQWKTLPVPSYEGWETVGLEGLDGAVWFRTTFDVPQNWQGKTLILDLNRIRDQDFTYVNGQQIGSTNGSDARRYKIPANVLKPGPNTIAIQVLNFFDKGGLAGYKDTSRPIAVYPEGESEKTGISLVKPWKYKIQNDEPPAVPRFQAAYQPFGDLYLDFAGYSGSQNYKRELDLNQAISRTTYTHNGITYTREYFASAPNQVVVVHLTANKPGSISFETKLSSPHKKASTRKIDNNTLGLSVQVRNGALKGESYLQVATAKGQATVSNDKISVTNADAVTLYLTAGTNYKNYKDVSADPAAVCKKALQTLKGKSYEQIKAAHIQEYQNYFNTFSISIGSDRQNKLPTDERLNNFATTDDPAFAALYVQYGRYLLISSSRPGSRPANLQGIWNDLLAPPWDSKYTTNINAEMNYWPAELLNLSPMHEPFLNMIAELNEAGKKTAKVHYNAPGWITHHNTDLWRGTAPINASNHGIWVGGSGWLSQHMWEHYRYTQDKEFLQKKAYPIMKEAAEFYNAFLVKDPKTGWLISTPSNSPEQGGLVAGPTMDHQIIRELFRNVIQASEILNTDQEFRFTLKEKLPQIAPNQIGKYGQLQEWLQDVDDPNNRHRHVSHLWGVHPGRDITWDDSPEMMRAARQSLIMRGDAGTGWSLAWKINFWARFKDGDHAYKMVTMLLSPAAKGGGSYVNLFDAHPPFQIDGNFGGAAGIAEMLVQSHTEVIDIFPALPSAFVFGEVNGLRARGGFELDMKWNDRKLQELAITSTAGEKCNLRYGNKTISFSTEKGKIYKLDKDLKLH